LSRLKIDLEIFGGNFFFLKKSFQTSIFRSRPIRHQEAETGERNAEEGNLVLARRIRQTGQTPQGEGVRLLVVVDDLQHQRFGKT
jgi:hypothetical protein